MLAESGFFDQDLNMAVNFGIAGHLVNRTESKKCYPGQTIRKAAPYITYNIIGEATIERSR